jgi:tetratricopeptide (TPR) repeat protein
MQLEEAAQEFQAELAINPDHGQALAYLADTEMKLGHPEAAPPPLEMAARALLEKSLSINPGLELVHLDLGILYVDASRQDDALRELKEAARLAPEDVNVHWRLGRLYRSIGRKDEAKAEFEKASQVNKSEDKALFDRINSEHARPPQAPPPPEAPAK